jgi:hypothetical protein
MRDQLFVQKLWNTFMRKQMERQMAKSEKIDEAFKTIKNATGVSDVEQMVSKFLERDTYYS